MPTALVVEDEAVIALDLASQLQSLGFEVLGFAKTYEQALEVAERCLPDIAIVDLVLSGAAEGARLSAALRARGVRVLMVTGGADPRRGGTNQAVLTKPWGREDLILEICKLGVAAA
jgi:CheY-like chemotaxis protein